jgi:hypothetical protein
MCCLINIPLQAQDLDAISVKKGLDLSGGLRLSNTFYAGSDSLIKRDPYVYYLTGDMNLNIFGFDLPFSFAYSNTSKRYQQPFNRFQIAPKYKWARLYVGSTSMNFSKYTLAGHQFRGAGVELTPGKWSVSGMYGRLMKPVEYDPLIDNISSVAYKRMGYGVKAGYASEGDEISVIFFTAKDDPQSLAYFVPDIADLHPQRNTTISLLGRKSFLKHFFVQAEYAFSVYNSELRNEGGDSLRTSNFVDRIFGKKTNDRYLDAMNASIGFQKPVWGVSVGYERVAPDYQTLGGYYFVNDVEIFKLSPNVSFWEQKIRVSGNIGLEYNNLDGMKANNTRRVVGSGNVAYSSGKEWSASVGYSNFSTYTRFKPRAYPYYVDNLDSLNFYQMTQTFNGNIVYTFGDEQKLMNTAMVMASYQTGSTKAGKSTNDLSNISTLVCSYGQQWIPTAMSWALFMSVNYAEMRDIESLYWGPGASVSKAFLDNTLSAGISCSYNQNRVNGMLPASLLTTALSATYTLKGVDEKFGKHTFQLNSGLTNRFKTAETKSYLEFLTVVTYGVRF